MTNQTPTPNPEVIPTVAAKLPSPVQCLSASLFSGVFATGLYFLTSFIAQAFANKPLPTSNVTAYNIAIAVRTLVVGLSTLATAIFGIVAVGLAALAIQIIIQQLKNKSAPPSNPQ
jgi:hypothetical protein